MSEAPSPASLALILGASDADLFTVREHDRYGTPSAELARAMLAKSDLPVSGRCVRAYLRGWSEHSAFLRACAELQAENGGVQ